MSGPMTFEEIDAGFGRPCGHICGIPQAEHRHEEHQWASSLRAAPSTPEPPRCLRCGETWEFHDPEDEACRDGQGLWNLAPSTPEPSGLTEASCPTCGRDCDHGRLAVEDLIPFDETQPPTRLERLGEIVARQAASLDAHHSDSALDDMRGARDRGDAICPVCRAAPSTEPALDVERVTITEKDLRDAWSRLDAVGDPRTAHTLWKHLGYARLAESQAR